MTKGCYEVVSKGQKLSANKGWCHEGCQQSTVKMKLLVPHRTTISHMLVPHDKSLKISEWHKNCEDQKSQGKESAS